MDRFRESCAFLQILIHRFIAKLVDLPSFAFPWPNSIICPSDSVFFGEFFRQNRDFSRSRECSATSSGTTPYPSGTTARYSATASRYRQNWPSDRPSGTTSGTTAGLSGTSRNQQFQKFVFAISFDSGLRFLCSLARFEATIKGYVTIAVDPPSTTTKIRGQARSFYIKR